MEELAFLIVRSLFAAITWLIGDFLFYLIFYYIGWFVCLVFTLGKYPAKQLSKKSHKRGYLDGSLVSIIGVISTVIAVVLIYAV